MWTARDDWGNAEEAVSGEPVSVIFDGLFQETVSLCSSDRFEVVESGSCDVSGMISAKISDRKVFSNLASRVHTYSAKYSFTWSKASFHRHHFQSLAVQYQPDSRRKGPNFMAPWCKHRFVITVVFSQGVCA